MDFGARSHGFSLRILKNHVLGVFWHFGLHPQVLASADIWNFEGQIFTKIQYSEPKIFWCQKCPMDSIGRNGQELCIISYSIIRFVGKFWHLEIISSEYRKVFIFSHFQPAANSDAKGIPWFCYLLCVLLPTRIREKQKNWWASVGITQKSILKMQFSTFLPFRGKTAKISRTQNFQTAQDLAKKIYTHVSRVITNIPCEFQQNWRGSLLNFSDIVWFLEIMSLNLNMMDACLWL